MPRWITLREKYRQMLSVFVRGVLTSIVSMEWKTSCSINQIWSDKSITDCICVWHSPGESLDYCIDCQL